MAAFLSEPTSSQPHTAAESSWSPRTRSNALVPDKCGPKNSSSTRRVATRGPYCRERHPLFSGATGGYAFAGAIWLYRDSKPVRAPEIHCHILTVHLLDPGQQRASDAITEYGAPRMWGRAGMREANENPVDVRRTVHRDQC